MSHLVECACCGRENDRGICRHRLCNGCYSRWLRLGRPAGGPPPPRWTRDVEGQVADLRFLITQGVTVRREQAARLGVSRRTVLRYAARIREEQQAQETAA